MRQDEPVTVEIGSNVYHIFPFAAFKAANISGSLFAIIGPALKLFASLGSDGDVDMSALTGFFSTLDGDVVEGLMRKLLIANRNISVEVEGKESEWLTGILADKIFCGDIGAMYRLAVEVIKVNYGSFFAGLGDLFGDANTVLLKKTSAATEN